MLDSKPVKVENATPSNSPSDSYPFLFNNDPKIHLLQTLAAQQTWMMDQIAKLTVSLQEVKEAQSQILSLPALAQVGRKKKRPSIRCPIEHCDRVYSSKISLNCHMRNKHPCKEEYE